ncbi:MAG: 50S ribosomal protein L24e, partial [Methanosarcinaceae archaeon]|nr:50S ribosomal protein L24e [Methanosarcinaceae archaeon]
LEPGTGKLYVKKDGSTYFICSSKCMSNLKLGRIPRRVAWTEKGRIQLKKA